MESEVCVRCIVLAGGEVDAGRQYGFVGLLGIGHAHVDDAIECLGTSTTGGFCCTKVIPCLFNIL